MKYNEELAILENVEILGFKGAIENIPTTLKKVDEIKDKYSKESKKEIIQLMNADAIAGKKHLQHGIVHATKAFERGENLAKDLGIEILLRTSGQRQISKALKILGLKEEKMNIAVVMINCSNEIIDELSDYFTRDDSILDINESKLLETYDISKKELNNICITDILIDKTTKLIVDN